MDIKVNVLSDSEHEIEVNLEYDEIQDEIKNAYDEERKTISHPGFRKGKIPPSLLKKLYGSAIEYKASEKIANKKFWDIVEEKELKPISTPKMTDIDFSIGEKLFFKVQYEVKPKIGVKDYTQLVIEKPAFKVKEEEIEKEIDYLLKENSKLEESETVEDENHKIAVNLQRLDENDRPVVGTRSENMSIDLTDPQVNPQIAQNSKGKKIGDTFNFTFVDEHYHGEEKHRVEYKYTAEIVKIEKYVYPELNEELVKKMSKDKSKTLDEFKEQIRENIQNYYDSQSNQIFTNSLLNKIVENNDFTPPPGYVESVLNQLVNLEKQNAQRYGRGNIDEKETAETLQPRAVWNAKWQIIMEQIAEKENISVTDEDIQKIAEEESERIGIPAEKLLKFYKDSNKTENLIEEKVIEFLKSNNISKEIDPDKREKAKETKESKRKKK